MAFERGGIRRWTARTLKSHNLWPAWIHFRESGVTRPSGGDLADCRCQADFSGVISQNPFIRMMFGLPTDARTKPAAGPGQRGGDSLGLSPVQQRQTKPG